jgi:hypothetical protein
LLNVFTTLKIIFKNNFLRFRHSVHYPVTYIVKSKLKLM